MAGIGEPPIRLLSNSKNTSKYFDENYKPIIVPCSNGHRLNPNSRPLEAFFAP
jgi:hypothetical protein